MNAPVTIIGNKSALNHSIHDVLISGAGLIGLILACELALAKCSVLILERAENPHSPLKQLPFGLRGLSAPSVEAHYRRGLGCEDQARASFHPFYDNEGRQPIPFPWERLNGKPLIYASMGTLVNGLRKVYGTILEAASEFPEMQMVLSVGRNFNPDDLGRIPSNTIVVRAAPQIDLLKRAALCITHAGLNTALEALAQGVPMVAIPVGFDQPGVAARIAYHGVGEFIEVGNLTTRRLSDLIAKIAENPKYRDKASWFQKVLSETRGLEVAADIVERAFEDRFEDKFRSRMLATSSAEETSFLP